VDFEKKSLVSLPIGLILGSCQVVYKNWHIDVIRCSWITIDLLLITPWKMWLQLSRNWPCWHLIFWLDDRLGPHPLFLHPKTKQKKNDDVWFIISPINCNQFQLIIDNLTCGFLILKQKVISIKTGRGVMMMWMEETLVPWEDNMEIINHRDPISYRKWGFRPFFFLEFCFMFMFMFFFHYYFVVLL